MPSTTAGLIEPVPLSTQAGTISGRSSITAESVAAYVLSRGESSRHTLPEPSDRREMSLYRGSAKSTTASPAKSSSDSHSPHPVRHRLSRYQSFEEPKVTESALGTLLVNLGRSGAGAVVVGVGNSYCIGTGLTYCWILVAGSKSVWSAPAISNTCC